MKKQKKRAAKICRIGGQALIEGIMMQGATATAISVRTPDGTIVTEAKRHKSAGVWGKIPLVRGVIAFVASLVNGVRCIMKSAEQAFPDEEQPSAAATTVSCILGVVIAVALFMLLPGWIADVIAQFVKMNILVRSLIEGAIRIAVFVGYLALVSAMKDIRRTFMYHGAEHRTINCYERGLDINVANVQSCSTRHNRCGTTFLFFVMIMSIIVFSLAAWAVQLIVGFVPGKWVLMCVRLLCLPLVAGLSYELLRFLALLPDNKFVDIFRAPGLALQKLTTRRPDDQMAEVAIEAFRAVLVMDSNPSYPERNFGEYVLCEVRDRLYERFDKAGIDRSDADWIICRAAAVRRSQLSEPRIIEKETYASILETVQKRLEGSPLDYIFGESEFFGLKIKVNQDVLIPRPETELLAEQALEFVRKRQSENHDRRVSALDMCCGSGCIAAVLARMSGAKVTAADISEKAVAVAKSNLDGTDAEVRVSDMFASFGAEKFDLIVCNPPYVASGDMEGLQSEVKREPAAALDGGADGMDFYRIIAASARGFLMPDGALMLEAGLGQAERIIEMLRATGDYGEVYSLKDLEGADRMVIAYAADAYKAENL